MINYEITCETYNSLKDVIINESLEDVFKKRRSTRLVLPSADLNILNTVQNLPGCYIAGGAALALYNGEFKHLKDWDLYFSSFSSYNKALEVFMQMGFENVNRSEFGSTLELKGYGEEKAVVQLMDHFWANEVKDIFNNFDFTVCCFAVCGKKIYYTQRAKEDEEKKEINIISLKLSNIALTLKRIARYGAKGYVPTDEVAQKLGEFFYNNKINLDQVIKRRGS